jgi:hypothetical protein
MPDINDQWRVRLLHDPFEDPRALVAADADMAVVDAAGQKAADHYGKVAVAYPPARLHLVGCRYFWPGPRDSATGLPTDRR